MKARFVALAAALWFTLPQADAQQGLEGPNRIEQERIARETPDFDQTLLARAVKYYYADQFAEAVYELDEAIRLKPERFELYHWRGIACMPLGHYEQAIADFTQVIDYDPDQTASYRGTAYSNRALVELHLGRFEAALADYEQADAINVIEPGRRGECLLALKRWSEALAAFDLMLDPEARQKLMDARGAAAKQHAVTVYLGLQSSDDPAGRDYTSLCGRANARMGLKDLAGAEADLQAAAALKPQDPRAYGILTWTYLLAGRFSDAQTAARKGLELGGGRAWIEMNLAHAYLLSGDFASAQAVYLGHKDEPYKDQTFVQTVLEDFTDLRAAGITSPDVARMEELLRQLPTPVPPLPSLASPQAQAAAWRCNP